MGFVFRISYILHEQSHPNTFVCHLFSAYHSSEQKLLALSYTRYTDRAAHVFMFALGENKLNLRQQKCLHLHYLSSCPPFWFARKNHPIRSGSYSVYDFETWHEAAGNGALQSLYKSWPWDDLDLFYGKVNLGH